MYAGAGAGAGYYAGSRMNHHGHYYPNEQYYPDSKSTKTNSILKKENIVYIFF